MSSKWHLEKVASGFQPGEIIVLYAVGFGPPTTPLTPGSSSQLGALPALPVIQFDGAASTVQFAGVISPGLYQLNVVVPSTAPSGDNLVTASYGGSISPAGSATPPASRSSARSLFGFLQALRFV